MKRNVTSTGKQLNYNASQQAKYVAAIRSLVRIMAVTTRREIMKLFKTPDAKEYFATDASIASQSRILMNALLDKFSQLFALKSRQLAERMVVATSRTSETNLTGSLKAVSEGLTLERGVVPEGMNDIAKATIAENVSLIRSIPDQYFKNVTGAVMRSITTGRGLADLVPQIKKFNGQTDRRAKNIALDQTRKAYNSINKVRMQSVGVQQFKWIHSGGSQHPRKSHIAISGKIFDFDNLESQQAALGVPPEDRGIPGFPVNCKCVMTPVITFDTE